MPSSKAMPPEYRAYMRRLERMAEGTFPRVIADTINTVAGFAHVQSIRNVRDRMTLRNQYTERSVRFYKANPKTDTSKINAITGSVQPYMATQETGGYRRPKQGRKVPVATLRARGGSPSRVVRKRYRAGQLGPNEFVGKPRGGNRPIGVWERTNHNKRLKMIRNLEAERVQIDATRWHSDAMRKYSSRKTMTDEFLRQARHALKK